MTPDVDTPQPERLSWVTPDFEIIDATKAEHAMGLGPTPSADDGLS